MNINEINVAYGKAHRLFASIDEMCNAIDKALEHTTYFNTAGEIAKLNHAIMQIDMIDTIDESVVQQKEARLAKIQALLERVQAREKYECNTQAGIYESRKKMHNRLQQLYPDADWYQGLANGQGYTAAT